MATTMKGLSNDLKRRVKKMQSYLSEDRHSPEGAVKQKTRKRAWPGGHSAGLQANLHAI